MSSGPSCQLSVSRFQSVGTRNSHPPKSPSGFSGNAERKQLRSREASAWTPSLWDPGFKIWVGQPKAATVPVREQRGFKEDSLYLRQSPPSTHTNLVPLGCGTSFLCGWGAEWEGKRGPPSSKPFLLRVIWAISRCYLYNGLTRKSACLTVAVPVARHHLPFAFLPKLSRTFFLETRSPYVA